MTRSNRSPLVPDVGGGMGDGQVCGEKISVAENLHDAFGQFADVSSAVLRVGTFHSSMEVVTGAFPLQKTGELGWLVIHR